jgi:hypothetical protein
LLHGRRNTLVKERILPERIPPSLQTANIIVAKIKAETTTKTMTETTTEIATETTVDLEDVATSARKRIANHGSIQTRNGQEQKRPTKASLITAQTDASTITLRDSSSNTLSSARKGVIKT